MIPTIASAERLFMAERAVSGWNLDFLVEQGGSYEVIYDGVMKLHQDAPVWQLDVVLCLDGITKSRDGISSYVKVVVEHDKAQKYSKSDRMEKVSWRVRSSYDSNNEEPAKSPASM